MEILHLAAPCRLVPVTFTLDRMEDLAPLLRAQLDSGTSLEDALAHLRAVGASPVGTIKAIHETLGVSLGEAKTIFDASPAWQGEVSAARDLHQQFLRILDEEGK